MHESDIDALVETRRATAEGLTTEEYRERLAEELVGFRDAVEGDPQLAEEFLSHLDLGPARSFLASLYKRPPNLPAEAMLRASVLMALKQLRFYPEMERYLETHPEEAVLLGFREEDGMVLTPDEKTLWHFDNKRIGDRWDEVFVLLRDAVVEAARRLGLPIGQKTMQDATPIRARENDKEAEYNGHYKRKGYKLDTVDDLETGLPLAKRVKGLNDDEARNLIVLLEQLRKAGIVVREHWIDCGYTDYRELAWMGVNGIEPHYRMAVNWVHNEKGERDNILRIYQQHWKDEGFRPNADLDDILRFLFERGCTEEVGAYFRNPVMAKYHEDPDAHMKVYHLRSRKEGNHGYWKEHLGMETRMRVKGLARVDRYLTRNLCVILVAALTRLQNGVRTNLTSVAFLT